jgi:hypothetical protein
MNIPFMVLRYLYRPICRMYSRYIVREGPVDGIMSFLCALEFWKVHGYWPNFRNPRSFSEKVFNRMLFDRDAIWTLLSDKLRVRDYVGTKIRQECLIPLLWTGDNPEGIPFDELPMKFVIKTNHGCAYNIIVKDKSQLDKGKTIRQLKRWLKENFYRDRVSGTAWAYKNIKPSIMVETFIDDNGKVPIDYKFFCYAGRAEFLQVSIDRFEDATERILDREFTPLDLYNGCNLYKGKVLRPRNYEDMVHLAERLAEDLNFVRVDLYNVDGKIYFGEMTCYPAGGTARFEPREYDFLFGAKWKTVSTN